VNLKNENNDSHKEGKQVGNHEKGEAKDNFKHLNMVGQQLFGFSRQVCARSSL